MSNTLLLPAAIVDFNPAGNNTVIALASGGTPPYKYRLINDGGFQDSPVFTLSSLPVELPIEVTDSAGNDNYNNYNIGHLVLQVSCTYNQNSFTIIATGGTSIYTYSVNGSAFGTDATFALQPGVGNYAIIVKDSSSSLGAALLLIAPSSN